MNDETWIPHEVVCVPVPPEEVERQKPYALLGPWPPAARCWPQPTLGIHWRRTGGRSWRVVIVR